MKKINIGGRCRNLFTVTIGKRGMVIASVLLLAVALVPLLRMAMYAVPWSDDYSYSGYTKGFVGDVGFFPGAFFGAAYVVKTWWYCWQGTFSSIFLMAWMPEAFKEGTYHIGIMVIILFFAFSAMVLCMTIMRKWVGAKLHVQVSVSVLVTLTMIVLIKSAQQGFYGYNPAIHYTFMHGVLFLFVATCIVATEKKGVVRSLLWMLLMTALAFVCSGSNFVTALQGFLLLGMFFLGMFVERRGRTCYYILPLLVYAVGLYYNISAPGNAVRSAQYQGQEPLEAILNSFVAGAKNLWVFTDWITLVILCCFVFIMWNTIAEMKFQFRWPVVVTVLSFCLYCTGFTSSLYGMGDEGLSRTLNVVKFTYQILLFINTTYWVGWGMRKFREKGKIVRVLENYASFYIIAFVIVVVGFAFDDNQAGHFSSYGAYYYVHTGEAANYYNEWQERFEIIKNGGEVIELEPLHWKPHLLCRRDLSTDYTAGSNTSLAAWYGKDKIYVKVPETENN